MRKWIMMMLFAISVTGGVVSCASTEPSEPDRSLTDESVSDDDGTTVVARPRCCQFGAYMCGSREFDYATPTCGGMTRPAARAACDQACTPACTDTGFGEPLCED